MSNFNSKKYKEASRMGFDVAQEITPSVLVVARLGKVAPKAFAKGLIEEEENSLYRADVSTALQKACVKRAVAETAKDAVGSLKKILGIGKD